MTWNYSNSHMRASIDSSHNTTSVQKSYAKEPPSWTCNMLFVSHSGSAPTRKDQWQLRDILVLLDVDALQDLSLVSDRFDLRWVWLSILLFIPFQHHKRLLRSTKTRSRLFLHGQLLLEGTLCGEPEPWILDLLLGQLVQGQKKLMILAWVWIQSLVHRRDGAPMREDVATVLSHLLVATQWFKGKGGVVLNKSSQETPFRKSFANL